MAGRLVDKVVPSRHGQVRHWAIEVLIKGEKQQLGLGDYRLPHTAAPKCGQTLHLVDAAYACLGAWK